MPSASVIVRARDEEARIEAALRSLRSQSIVPQIIVVDSGSTDRTVAIAARYADELVRIEPAEFSFGAALNLGASLADAPVHFALSAHCVAAQPDWIERSLAHYDRPDVAGTGGWEIAGPVFVQDHAHALTHPYVGFSNHASSWRAAVWETHRFDERLPTYEDKEWALRVLADGWRIVLDPALAVSRDHVWTSGLGVYLRRTRNEWRVAARVHGLPPYGVRDALGDWWGEDVGEGAAAWRRRGSLMRIAGLGARWAGRRGA
jgi:glycosyltransferase involved in cell wall biosynthesis